MNLRPNEAPMPEPLGFFLTWATYTVNNESCCGVREFCSDGLSWPSPLIIVPATAKKSRRYDLVAASLRYGRYANSVIWLVSSSRWSGRPLGWR